MANNRGPRKWVHQFSVHSHLYKADVTYRVTPRGELWFRDPKYGTWYLSEHGQAARELARLGSNGLIR